MSSCRTSFFQLKVGDSPCQSHDKITTFGPVRATLFNADYLAMSQSLAKKNYGTVKFNFLFWLK